MLNLLNRFLLAGLLMAASPIHGFASPAQSKLLPLIPHEVQLVAGIEDPANPDTRGHLLLVTVRNTFDFDDWQSLTGVDNHRSVDETIWLAASSSQGELDEHALLVAGRFDREHIFQAAEQNGAATGIYRGLEVLVVKPFAREERQMHDARWMAILDGRTAVFGTPWLVQKVLDRYAGRESADPLVVDRLERLHPQVKAWSMILVPHAAFSKDTALGESPAPWVDLLGRDMLEDADELTVGIRYGTTARVDFVVRTASDQKTSPGAEGFAWQHGSDSSQHKGAWPRLENLSKEQNLIQGSIVLPGKQLYACFKFAFCGQPVPTIRASR